MSFRTTYTTDIAAPVGRVFALVEDPEQGKLWRTGVVSSERTKEVPGGVGSTFVERIKEGRRVVEYTGEVTAYSVNRELGVRIGNPHFSADVTYRFAPAGHDGDHTRLDYHCVTTIRNPAVRILMGWFVRWFSGRVLAKMMGNLKAVAEGRPPADPAS